MNELVGSDFHSMMQRYVGMSLLEDEFDEAGITRIKHSLELKNSLNKPLIPPPFCNPSFTGSSLPRRRMVISLGMSLEKEMMDLLFYQYFLMPNETQRPMQMSSFWAAISARSLTKISLCGKNT